MNSYYLTALFTIVVVSMIIANKKAFTLLELVIALGILSVGILGVLTVLQEGFRFVDKTRQDVVAINLAREWVESVFTIRNTNRRKRSWKRDECWLLQDPFAPVPTTACQTSPWLGSWTYLLQRAYYSGQYYPMLSGGWSELLDVSDGISANESQFALCETWTGRTSCPGGTWSASEWLFYRQIIGKWLYRKDVSVQGGEFIDCPNGSTPLSSGFCGDERAKEFRFCVRVGSIKQWTNTIEQCAVMTNFLE